MKNPIVKVDTRRIKDETTFHDTFAELFGFLEGYGRNMNAWIDCMTCLDQPADGMTTIHAPPGGVVVIQLDYVDDFVARCPDLYDEIVECSALVNFRRIDMGNEPVLALSFYL